MYRTVAPWVTENPIYMNVLPADPATVRRVIDQCAEVGFEMAGLSFGSGFDIENEDPAYVRQIKELADYAHAKGIALGGYSLLASRSVGPEHDVIDPKTGKPGGAVYASMPCLGSRWGAEYLRKVRTFIERAGLDLFEHDGSYPGDLCARPDIAGHRGAGRLAMDALEEDHRALPLVPGTRRLSERARLVLLERLEQGFPGLPRRELDPAARRASAARAGKTFLTAPGRKRRAWAGRSCRW